MLSQNILNEIEIVAQQQNLPIIGNERGKILTAIIKQVKPKKILEIGTLVGYSSILMAQFLPEDGHILTIEKDRTLAKKAIENIQLAGFSQKIEVIVGDAIAIIPRLEGKIDLLFLDGAKDEYFKYLKLTEPKLSSEALIIADNVQRFSSHMEKFLHYLRNSSHFESRTYFFKNDAVEVARKICV